MVTIPYNEAIRLWRGGEEVWYQNPKFAPPEWSNFFSSKKLPASFIAKSSDGGMTKSVTLGAQNTSSIHFTHDFEFNYDGYPQEMLLYFKTKFETKQPFVSVYLLTPDGRKLRIADMGVSKTLTYRFSQDEKLKTRLKSQDVVTALCTDPKIKTSPTPL